MEEGHHAAPGDAVREDALSHLHEDFLDTVPLDLADQAERNQGDNSQQSDQITTRTRIVS